MEKMNLPKMSYSISSLSEKTDSFSFSLNDSIKKSENEFYVKEIKNFLPEVNYLCVNKQANKVEVNFIRHKRKRQDNPPIEKDISKMSTMETAMILDELEYQNINSINSSNELIINIYKEKVKQIQSLFYEKDPFSYFLNMEEYQALINNFFYVGSSMSNISPVTVPPHLKQALKSLSEVLFEKDLNKNLISLNKIEGVFSELLRFYNSSLYVHIFRQLESIYNVKSSINKVILVGDKGIGKSYAIMLYSIFLRMNPYNLVFSIFNIDEFLASPFSYLSNEVLYSLYFLYNNNSALDVRDLEKFFCLYHSKLKEDNSVSNLKQSLEKFKKMIEQVIKAYDNKINVYVIIDNYERIFNNNSNITNLTNNEKLEFIDLLENFKLVDQYTNCKTILSLNTENNELIIQKFKEIKVLNDLEALEHRIIFLNSAQILKDEDFIIFVEKKFGYTNRNIIKNIIKYSGHNYNHISSYFNSIPANRYEEFIYLKDSHVKAFFIDIMGIELHRLIDNKETPLEKKVYTLYNLFSYKCNQEKQNSDTHNIHLKYDFYSKEIYKHYIYKYVHPEYLNGNITFKIINELVFEFLISFCYEEYFKKLKLKYMDMKFYSDWYSSTNDQFLRGIFVEELAYLFFKNSKVYLNQEFRYFFLRIENFGFYSKGNIVRPEEEIDMPYYGKINNPNNLFIQEGRIIIKIEKIKKFYSAEDQIFGGDKILKFTNGIYFLNPKFPIIDAIVVNQERKNLILIQIKKTMKQKFIEDYFDDFHTLYFLLENPDYYRKIFELFMNESRHDRQVTISTKLQLYMKLAHFIKNGWSLNFMFTYRHIDNSFEFINDNQILENYYITYDKLIEASNVVIDDENFRKNENVLGNFKIENKTISIFRRRILHNTIMVDLNDLTNGLIDGKKFSNFIK